MAEILWSYKISQILAIFQFIFSSRPAVKPIFWQSQTFFFFNIEFTVNIIQKYEN